MEKRILVYGKEITEKDIIKDLQNKIAGKTSILSCKKIDDTVLKEKLFAFLRDVIAEEKGIFLTHNASDVIFDELNFEFAEFYTLLVDTIKRCAKEYEND